MRRIFAMTIALGFAVVAGGAAAAAIGNDPSLFKQTADKSGTSVETRTRDDERLRDTGDKVCHQAVDTAAQIGEQLRVIGATVLPAMTQMGEEFAREMKPTMRELEPKLRVLGDRLREMAHQMDEALSEKRSTEKPSGQR